ncbi:MAG: hypothetical protein Q8S84_02905 [bacterium]|nr:hypothetical protein [bacterium]MDP3380484.1 hypothetical protein [bacterium]
MFLINISNQNIIIEIDTILVNNIDIAILFTNLYSRDSLFLSASSTFQKLSVGTISSIYLDDIQLLTK